MNSTHNILDILKLLSECYYNNPSIGLVNNQNNFENRFLVVLKETPSLDYKPQWYNQIKQIIISSENETDSKENESHDRQIFLDLFKNMCRVLGDKIKLCPHPSSLLRRSNTNNTNSSIIGFEQNIETQCPFSLILGIFKLIIDCQLDILFSCRSSSNLHKLISTIIDQSVCQELFDQDILLEHQQQQTGKNCTIWWINWFYESSWDDNLYFNESLHSLHHLIDTTSAVIDILGRCIPKLNKEAEINLNSNENEQQKDDSREIKRKNYVIMSELFVKMTKMVVRSMDEVLIPIVMVHVESMKQDVQTQYSQQIVKKAEPIITIALKLLTNLFEIPSISQIIMENTQLREQIESWKKSYACKLVKSGIIRFVLEQNFQLNQITKCNFDIFNSFIIVIIRTLAGFQSESRHMINKQGNIIPYNIAFANLPHILSILANDPARDSIQFKQQLDRASLAVLFVTEKCGDRTTKNSLSASLIYQILTRFITKYFSLDFLHGVSMIHFLYLFIVYEAESNNLSEFKPHTYSKILSGLQATFTIRENDSISEISTIEQLFFSCDYVFMPWIWRVSEGSWSLKEFVANLMNRWLSFRFQTYCQLNIDVVIQREIRVNIEKDRERAFIKVGKLLFKNPFALQVLLMSFSSLRFQSDDNGKKEITRLFMIVASIFFCIVISHHNQLDSAQSLEEEKDLMANLSKFWMEMIKLMITPGIVENVPTDWWPIVNSIVLTLGYHFDSKILSGTAGTINFSGVFDHTLRILQNVNKVNTNIDKTNIKLNDLEKKEKSMRLSMISHFLMAFSSMKNETAAQEMRQHPILLSALRQWTFNKMNTNALETAENDTIYNEIKSSIVGLLSLTISTNSNNQQQEIIPFPTIYELETLLNEFKREPSLLVGHLCTIISSGSLSMEKEFKQKMRLMYINIWNMLRDFIVSEIDNHFTWLMLLPITNAFKIMIKNCDANLSNYLVGNKWNCYMLKTIIRCAMFYYQKTNDICKNCSHMILQKQFLHGIVHMTEYFVTINVSWIKLIFTENIIEFFISLIKNVIEEQKIDFIFLEILLRMLYQLYEHSLLSESQRIQIHTLMYPIFEEPRRSNIMKISISDNAFDHILIMVRPYPNHQFKLFSLGRESRIEENLERLESLLNDFAENRRNDCSR